MNWYKKAQETRWFEWDNPNAGDQWTISYRNIEPDELYEAGRSLSDKVIMEKMITKIQNLYSDEPLNSHQMLYWLEKFPLTTEEFFEKVQEANSLFRDEQRIEQRDIDMGISDR